MTARAALVLTIALAPAGWGHGIIDEPASGGIGIRALYADGTPVAFAGASAYEPGSTNIFAEGLTDRNGRFVFVPSITGMWRVVVDDGMGHAIDTVVDAAGQFVPSPSAAHPASRAGGMLAGVGIIFGLFGVWALARGRRPRST